MQLHSIIKVSCIYVTGIFYITTKVHTSNTSCNWKKMIWVKMSSVWSVVYMEVPYFLNFLNGKYNGKTLPSLQDVALQTERQNSNDVTSHWEIHKFAGSIISESIIKPLILITATFQTMSPLPTLAGGYHMRP